MKVSFLIFLISLVFNSHAASIPDHYEELLDYVQESPDQGEANTCLFMANTGAMELLANKKADIKHPVSYGTYDLSESYIMWAKDIGAAKSFYDAPVLRFNGSGVHSSFWPFEAWINGRVNRSVWDRHPDFNSLPKISLPLVETIKLFQFGGKWSTRVLDKSHIKVIKESLWKYKSPILVNYNDEGFWHVVLIVGYDDRLPGPCYDNDPKDCSGMGSFYVRDSFGVKTELRDYDWFKIKGNAAFVVKLK